MAGMPSMLSDGSMLTLSKEAHTRMLAADKCDITKINPLFGSDLVYKCKVRLYCLIVLYLKMNKACH